MKTYKVSFQEGLSQFYKSTNKTSAHMKRILIPIFLLALIGSCSTEKTSEQKHIQPVDSSISNVEIAKDIAILADEDRVDTIVFLTDKTYHFPNYEMKVEKIDSVYIPNPYEGDSYLSKIALESLSLYETQNFIEKYKVKTQGMYFKRKGRTLTLSLANGKTKILKDNLSDDGDDFIEYTYENLLKHSNTFFINCKFYESSGQLLVNRETGDEQYTWGRTYPNPSETAFISLNEGLHAGEGNNGFQFISLDNRQYIARLNIEGVDWEPVTMKWIDDTTMIIKTKEWKTSNIQDDFITKFYRITFTLKS